MQSQQPLPLSRSGRITHTLRRALDIGCGLGEFARKVASRAEAVIALDKSEQIIQRAREHSRGFTNLTFINEDFMQYPLELFSYDFISALAVLHHLPFTEGIERMKLAAEMIRSFATRGLPRGLHASTVIYKRVIQIDEDCPRGSKRTSM